MPYTIDDEYFYGTTSFQHELRIDPKSSLDVRFLPVEFQIAMMRNKVKANNKISMDHLEWLERNCSFPFMIWEDYILFTDETDRTMFLTAH